LSAEENLRLTTIIREYDEFLYEDVKNGTGKQKKGYNKVKKCCKVAAADGYKYVWVDTCCIDKSSSAELSEAINSMFQWYSDSDVCYVYLSDVDNFREGQPLAEKLQKSRWVFRGWYARFPRIHSTGSS
jgi:uncharacterized protein YerC